MSESGQRVMQAIESRRRRQRGAALAAVGIAMGAFIALTVVGVDLGRLAFTATEVQTIADVGATAGAQALATNFATGGSLNPVAQAQTAAAQNRVDGSTASLAAGDVQVGNYNFATNAFAAGGLPSNAVRVNAQATVTNIVAGALGDALTTVQKTATAAFGGITSGAPVLPLAVGECHFQAFQGSGSCSDLPSLTQAPSPSDNTCWTSLGPNPASASQVSGYLPTTCCQGGNCGGGQPAPSVTVGSVINLVNGQMDSVLKIIKDCFDDGIREFLVPVVTCNNCTHAMTVTGFATIRVDSVRATGNPKGIWLTSFCKADAFEGGLGGTSFGTVSMALVR